jgi:hypothetical protein
MCSVRGGGGRDAQCRAAALAAALHHEALLVRGLVAAMRLRWLLRRCWRRRLIVLSVIVVLLWHCNLHTLPALLLALLWGRWRRLRPAQQAASDNDGDERTKRDRQETGSRKRAVNCQALAYEWHIWLMCECSTAQRSSAQSRAEQEDKKREGVSSVCACVLSCFLSFVHRTGRGIELRSSFAMSGIA